MQEENEIHTPLFVLDDDDWLDVFPNVDALRNQVEVTYLDEIVAAYDAKAKALALVKAGPRNNELSITCSLREDLPGLSAAIESFFSAWTRDDPPSRSGTVDDYVQRAVAAYQGAVVLRRHNRPRPEG